MLTAVLCLVLCLTGCADKNLYVTSFDARYLLSVGEQSVTVGEYNMLLLDTQRQYEAYYNEILGTDIWERKIDETRTFADYVQKDIVLDELVILELLQLEAANLQMVLSEEEKEQVQAVAAAYMSRINEATLEFTHTSQNQAADLIGKYLLAGKVIDYYSEHTDLEVSENQARTVRIQAITLGDEAAAENIAKEAAAGTEFAEAAGNYSDAELKEYTVVRGQLKADVEDIVFLMKQGECSPVIQTEDGCCLIYCVDDYLEEQTELNRQKIIRERIYNAWYPVVRALREENPLMMNEGQWSKIDMASDEEVQAGFFAVYHEWFEGVDLHSPQ